MWRSRLAVVENSSPRRNSGLRKPSGAPRKPTDARPRRPARDGGRGRRRGRDPRACLAAPPRRAGGGQRPLPEQLEQLRAAAEDQGRAAAASWMRGQIEAVRKQAEAEFAIAEAGTPAAPEIEQLRGEGAEGRASTSRRAAEDSEPASDAAIEERFFRPRRPRRAPPRRSGRSSTPNGSCGSRPNCWSRLGPPTYAASFESVETELQPPRRGARPRRPAGTPI